MVETETDCNDRDGITVGLVDALLTLARVLAPRLREGIPHEVKEALEDLREDPDVAEVVDGGGWRYQSDPRARAVWELNLVRVWNKAMMAAAVVARPDDQDEDSFDELEERILDLRRDGFDDFYGSGVEDWYRRRDELCDLKDEPEGLSEEDAAELKALRLKIESLPSAQTPEDQEHMDWLRDSARLLRKALEAGGKQTEGEQNELGRVVQVRNPRSDRYVKIDRSAGEIVAHKDSEGPWDGIPIVKPTAGSKPLTYHVIRQSGMWAVMRTGAKKAYRRFSSKRKAVMTARSIRGVTAIYLHRSDGTVERKIEPAVVQLRNPRSDRYVKIDRSDGSLEHKTTPGPFGVVPIVGSKPLTTIAAMK